MPDWPPLLAIYLLAAIVLYAALVLYVRTRYGRPSPLLVAVMAFWAALLAVVVAAVAALGGGR